MLLNIILKTVFFALLMAKVLSNVAEPMPTVASTMAKWLFGIIFFTDTTYCLNKTAQIVI